MNISTESWVKSANTADSDFPLRNLPYGVFETEGRRRIGVAIGDQILDLAAAANAKLFDGLAPETVQACEQPQLNALMALGPKNWAELRRHLTEILQSSATKPVQDRVAPLLVSMKDATMGLPAAIADYTDFYASIYHATNAGKLFRPDNPLLPNYKYVPIGYHGRASSIVVSGTDVQRPNGQTKAADASEPTFGPCRLLDYELEVGMFIGTANSLGKPVSIEEAESHIFGFCLLNDWSARDIQAWEYQPLGPFLAKNFSSMISPWVVTREALEPYRLPALVRSAGDPAPLPYLSSARDQQTGAIDLHLELTISSGQMRQKSLPPMRLSLTNLKDLYWTPGQMVAHHTSGGCNLNPGDLLGTGTVSGPNPGSAGCLMEMTRRGADPVELPSGEKRTFLEDGDEITIYGYCEKEGNGRIGFGECRGRITPALNYAKGSK